MPPVLFILSESERRAKQEKKKKGHVTQICKKRKNPAVRLVSSFPVYYKNIYTIFK